MTGSQSGHAVVAVSIQSRTVPSQRGHNVCNWGLCYMDSIYLHPQGPQRVNMYQDREDSRSKICFVHLKCIAESEVRGNELLLCLPCLSLLPSIPSPFLPSSSSLQMGLMTEVKRSIASLKSNFNVEHEHYFLGTENS